MSWEAFGKEQKADMTQKRGLGYGLAAAHTRAWCEAAAGTMNATGTCSGTRGDASVVTSALGVRQ